MSPTCAVTFFPSQGNLYHAQESPGAVLRLVLQEKPSAELRTGHIWRIGNLSYLDEYGLAFLLGRSSKQIFEKYDENQKDFIDVESETAPYTYVFVDTKLEICAIAGKPKLAPNPQSIALRFEKLLNSARAAQERHVNFEVAKINDPEGFIEHLYKAYAIKRFSMSFGLPNPFDVNQDFQAPMEKLLAETAGRNGRTSVEGEKLSPNVLAELARSAAASGNDATAVIQIEDARTVVRVHLKGNPVMLDEREIEFEEEKKSFLERIRQIYARIRRHEQGLKNE